MKKTILSALALISASCGDIATSQQNALGPSSDSYVVTYRYEMHNDLKRRMSLIMPSNSIELLKLEGTSALDVIGLTRVGTVTKVNGFEQIKREDFMALRLVPLDAVSNAYELREYESDRRIGKVQLIGSYSYYLTELCTGATERECEFRFDPEDKTFSVKFFSEAPIAL